MSKSEIKLGLFSRIKQRLGSIRRSIDVSRHVGVLVVLCFVGIYGTFRILLPQNEAAQVRFIETRGAESDHDLSAAESQIKNPFSGADYDNAVRLREASALGMAVSLSVLCLNSETGKLPGSVAVITQHLERARLLPPGVHYNSGTIVSEQSTFQLAYRREPLSFEVLAIPRSDQGSLLLFRFPLSQSEPNTVSYFEALRDKAIPPPLSTTEQLSASGWKIRHWRGDAISLNSATVESLKEQSAFLLNAR
ncbi:MAG TPA: hypothetical protein PLL77_16180 [Pyrinomonadaceae bacterium]|nr:hypothetical protein [Pyrinomonadaceae bacterium]